MACPYSGWIYKLLLNTYSYMYMLMKFLITGSLKNFLQKHSFANIIQNRCNFTTFTGKQLSLESPFNKVAGLKACNFIKKRLQHRCFLVKFAKFLRTLFFTKHLCQLLLFLFEALFESSLFNNTSLQFSIIVTKTDGKDLKLVFLMLK